MRIIAISIFLVTYAAALAQSPPTDVDRQKELDAVLEKWSAAMAAISSLEAAVERTSEDRVFGTKETYKGTARFLRSQRPGERSRASLYLVDATKPQNFEHFVLTPEFFYEASPSTKEIRVHELPKPQPGQNADVNPIGLLFGMKAAEAKQRYEIELKKTDQHYHQLQIKPRLPQDKADFAVAHLFLKTADFMPRQLVLQQPNKNSVVWDLPTINTKTNLRPADLDTPTLPPGWKMNRMPAAPTPSEKARSSGK